VPFSVRGWCSLRPSSVRQNDDITQSVQHEPLVRTLKSPRSDIVTVESIDPSRALEGGKRMASGVAEILTDDHELATMRS
jgi:hypothetical protein